MAFPFVKVNGLAIREWFSHNLGFNQEDYYLIYQGKLVYSDTFVDNGNVHVYPTVKGGKGGFGSMLRAIGAQIEKTTNREACRDLSGRRLRDINEEKRLKNWIDQQAEREKEVKERKQKKLERLCEPPKHEFNDEEYNKERSVLPEIVEDAVLQGLQASASCSTKRKQPENTGVVKKKKAKLWVDDDLDEEISDDKDLSDSGDDSVHHSPKITDKSGHTPSDALKNEDKSDNVISSLVTKDDTKKEPNSEENINIKETSTCNS